MTEQRNTLDKLGRCNINKRGPKVMTEKDKEWAIKMAAIRRNAKLNDIR